MRFMKPVFFQIKVICLVILLNSSLLLAAMTPKQTLNEFGRELRGFKSTISYIGVTHQGEVCKIEIGEDTFGFIKTRNGRIDADSVYNAYLGNQFSQDEANIDKNVRTTDPQTGALTREVAISSSIDKSSVELLITQDFKGFVSGVFKITRPSMYDEICLLKAESSVVL